MEGKTNEKMTPEQEFGHIKSPKKRGRPKKRPREFSPAQIYKDVLEISELKVHITVEGKRKLVTYGEAAIYRLFIHAVVNGNMSALKQVIELMMKALDYNVERKPTIFKAINDIMKDMDDYPNMQTYAPNIFNVDFLRERTKPL